MTRWSAILWSSLAIEYRDDSSMSESSPGPARGRCRGHLVTCNISTVARDPDNSSRRRVSAHRARLRAVGLRPVQIWVPDVRSSKFAAEARRQSEAVARSEHAAEDEAFIAAISLDDE